MSAIGSNIGLVSGLPVNDIIDSLIGAQTGPLRQLQLRAQNISASRTAFVQLSAQLLSVRNAASSLKLPTLFNGTSATSSNESVLLAQSSPGTPTGEFTFAVRNLATSQQLISSGFTSANNTPVGLGTITLERAAGQLNQATRLSALNGGAGVRAGEIRITDKSGNVAEIDIVTAKTIDDVVAAINNEPAVNVRAEVRNNQLVIEDLSGGTSSLVIADVGAGQTATDLGIVGSSSGTSIDGRGLVFLSETTRLSVLNDGNGVRTRPVGGEDIRFNLSDGSSFDVKLAPDLEASTPLALLNQGNGIGEGTIRITNRRGESADIDISGLQTIGDVTAAINAETDLNVRATVGAGRITLADESLDGLSAEELEALETSEFIVEDVEGTVGDALGIIRETGGSEIVGTDIFQIDTVGDLLNVINLDPDNQGRIVASIAENGLGIQITDTSGGAVAIEALGGSRAAEDLGLTRGTVNGSELEGADLLSGLNTVFIRTLNGGQGVDRSDLRITDADGNTAAIDLSSANTLTDIIDAINNAGLGVEAAVSSSGLGLALRDTTTATGTANFSVEGITAISLGIEGTSQGGSLRGENLQRKYISEATRLEDFNAGRGVPRGRFRITNSLGTSAVIDLTQGDERTIQDVIDEINSRGLDVEARINDTGDGLALIDNAGGTLQLKVEEDGSTVARALNILGTAEDGFDYIDGTFERRIETSAADSLEDVARKIRESGADVAVSVVNDGSGSQPFRLSITGQRSGLAGAIAIDGGQTRLGFDTIVQARDATVIFGPAGGDSPFVISSATNTLNNAVEGLSIDLVQASSEPVTIAVSEDRESIVEDVRSFVDAYNNVIGFLDDVTDFNPETTERGILQADGTARRVRSTLTGLFGPTVSGLSSNVDSFADVGIRIGPGSQLILDEARLAEAIENDPEGVAELFTLEETDDDGNVVRRGLASRIQAEIDSLTDPDNGAISLRDQSLQNNEEQLNDRISDFEALLNGRRTRLEAEFANLESVIAQLQSQQTALAGLQQLQFTGL